MAEDGQRVLGTCVLHPNRLGGGSHVANCGHMTAADATGQGVARAQGFRAMPFNFVSRATTGP
ncbi:MAG: hypothetical protein KUA38_06910 [Hydrogenophaga sp.]|nr:hypothetical protein [Hydrogenophaga sp.]